MSGADQDQSDKSHEATPQKLQKAREKGDVARSSDLSVAAAYAGLLLAALAFGSQSLQAFGTALVLPLDQPDRLAKLVFSGSPAPVMAVFLRDVSTAAVPWFAVPTALVLLSILTQRGMVFASAKIVPKLSRISIVANAKNKFGRGGLFDFTKSTVKLVLYSICLGFFIKARLPELVGVVGTSPRAPVILLVHLCVEFLFLALLIAIVIGAIDAVWQHLEYRRKNQMSRKEVMDEAKESEGDPHIKQQRRYRGQALAAAHILADVSGADVVIVNPTHYAVALKWSRAKGSAPVCVAKGVDEIAATIREAAQSAGVPIHRDPPTARALHATVKIGEEITEDLYGPVAAAIRFAEAMRIKARGQVY